MKTWLAQIARLKPEFLPGWAFWTVVAVGVSCAAVAAAGGLWVLFTQIEFL